MKKIFAACLFIFLVVGFGNLFFQLYWMHPEKNSALIFFEVQKGEGIRSVVRRLADGGLLSGEWLFRWYAKYSGMDRKLQAGIFTLYPGESIQGMLRILTNAEAVERTITIVEGWTIQDIDDFLAQENILKSGVLVKATESFSEFDRYPYIPRDIFLNNAVQYPLQGYLFPDTYRIFQKVTAEELIKKFLSEFDRKFTKELQEEIARQEKTIHEVVTMASILESEVQTPADKKKVADILWRRLDIGMALQVDSTVNYVTGKQSSSASFKDIEHASPYNTYRYRGLPPGPISNPGMDSILAAIYREENEYWFFLTGVDGAVHYARTLEEHAANRKYLP